MLKTRKLLMIKRRQDGSTFTAMFSGFLSSSPYLQLPLVPAPSYSLCKNLLIHLFPFIVEAFFKKVIKLSTQSFSINFSCAAQSSFLCLHWLVYSIPTTEELYLLHLWSYMLSHLELLDILPLPSIFNLKGLIGYT